MLWFAAKCQNPRIPWPCQNHRRVLTLHPSPACRRWSQQPPMCSSGCMPHMPHGPQLSAAGWWGAGAVVFESQWIRPAGGAFIQQIEWTLCKLAWIQEQQQQHHQQGLFEHETCALGRFWNSLQFRGFVKNKMCWIAFKFGHPYLPYLLVRYKVVSMVCQPVWMLDERRYCIKGKHQHFFGQHGRVCMSAVASCLISLGL